jgi:AcrR family transcriptional regulator
MQNKNNSTNLTREYIKQAMLELLAKTSVDKISITDLVARAGVSRTAFYRNFSSKDDLIEELILELIDILSISNPNILKSYSIDEWEEIYAGIRSKKKELLLITKASVENIGIINHKNIFSKEIIKINSDYTYTQTAFHGALNSIITKWVLSDMKESDREIAEITYSIFHNDFNDVK